MRARINIADYKLPYSEKEHVDVLIKEKLEKVIRLKVEQNHYQKIEVFNMEGKAYDLNSGVTNKRLVVLVNATNMVAGENVQEELSFENGIMINGKLYPEIKRLLQPHKEVESINILSDEGHSIAHYVPDTEMFYIHFKLTLNNVEILDKIMEEFDKEVIKPKKYEASWIHTSQKDKLVQQVKEKSKRVVERELQEEEERYEEHARDISNLIRRIKERTQKKEIASKNIIRLKDNKEQGINKIVIELDNIASLPLVNDIYIEGDTYVIHLNEMYTHADNKRFYLGEMMLRITPEDTSIKFFAKGEGRQGYWTRHDPHPHVNGQDGVACLGNVGATIAELSAYNELYALTMVAIDFLENTNTEDVAGRNVYNWDVVDPETNEVLEDQPSYEEASHFDGECEMCGDEEVYLDDLVEVYHQAFIDQDDNLVLEDSNLVCGDCLADYRREQREGNYVHENAVLWQQNENEEE